MSHTTRIGAGLRFGMIGVVRVIACDRRWMSPDIVLTDIMSWRYSLYQPSAISGAVCVGVENLKSPLLFSE